MSIGVSLLLSIVLNAAAPAQPLKTHRSVAMQAVPRIGGETRGVRPVMARRPEHYGLGEEKAWLQYRRGERLYRWGAFCLGTGVVVFTLTAIGGSLAILFAEPFYDSTGPKIGPGILVGLGVPSIVLMYVGGSLMVKGNRLRRLAMLEIFRSRKPTGTSLQLTFSLGGLRLGGQF